MIEEVKSAAPRTSKELKPSMIEEGSPKQDSKKIENLDQMSE